MSKEQELAELHRTIWKIANELRGSVDGWDFKNYVLGMLFYRFISEDLTRYADHLVQEAGEADFSYEALDDADAENARGQFLQEKGYFILPSELFQNVHRRAKDDENLNVTLTNIFRNIENSANGTPSEPDMKGLFSDLDVNSNKLGATVAKRNEKLVRIMDAIADMKLGNRIDQTNNDTFGDAYEFLMTMYASNAGKSGGERAYDPACGSGSLLLQFKKLLGSDCPELFGQEINITTYNLCRINMFLHGMEFSKFDIQHGDTLTDPKHWDDEPFDAIASNPPYSIQWDGDANPLLINDSRFSPAGVLAPKSKADLAFTMHMLSWLATSGTAAIVEFPGVLYRGGAEQKIREYLISNNYVDTVIQLPDNLFFGVSIATCIIVLKKSKADSSILFVDASKQCVKEGNKNKLTEENIETVYQAVMNRKKVDYFTQLVSNDDVLTNGANLSVSSYVEQEDTREKVDIRALNQQIAEMVERQNKLKAELDQIIAELN